MKKKIAIFLIIAVLAGIVILAVINIGKSIARGKQKSEQVVYNVGIIKLAKQNVNKVIPLQGIVEGDPQVKVYSSVPGKLQDVLVKEGQIVTKDQTIILINRDIVGAEYKAAPVHSPISGMVTKIYFIDRGASISPDKPVAEITNDSKIKLVISVGEEDLLNIKSGTPATITSLHDSKIQVNAQVTSTTPYVEKDTLSGTIIVKADNADKLLKVGMSVNVDIDSGTINAFMVPEKAILLGDKRMYVYINKNGKAKEVDVKRGYQKEGFMEISGELSQGDEIIVDGNFKLFNGANVKIIE
jgi:multidrug efflux pump subunit AcrA (membrane-fusion protein)